MADNKQLPATGTGTADITVATDEIAGVDWQKVKLADGTDGSTAMIGGDATNGLDVDVTRLPSLPAGSANIGDVDIASIAAGDNNIGNVDIVTMPAIPAGTNNIGDVDVVTLPSLVAGTANIGDVDVLTLPSIPAGTNNIGDVDVLSMNDGGNSITVDAPAGTPVNVQVGDGANTATIRNLAANDALNVAIVDGSGGQITSFGGGTQYAEDTLHTTGDQVTLAGVVQQSADAALSGDGDRSLLQVDGSGYLKVNVKAGPAGGDGAILDGVSGAIKATVFDYTNSNPLSVRLTDTSGDYVGAGGGTQYDEDTVSSAADKITMAGVVRKDTAATLVDTDGDRTQLQVDATGRLHVNGSGVTQPVSAASLPLPTGASTLAEQQTQSTSLAAIESDADAIRIATQLIDDPVQVLGTDTYTEATSKGMTIGAVRRDADTTLVGTTNEFGPLQMDANGRLKVEVFDGGDSHTVDGTVAVSSLPALVAGTANIGDVDVLSLPALPTGDNNIGNVDVLTLPALVAGSANIGDVDVLTMPNVTLAAGTNTNEVVGDVGADSPAAGNPLLQGGARETMADSAPASRVSADGDVERIATLDGAQYVIPTGPQTISYHDDDVAAVTTDGTVHAAPGAGLSIYITDIIFSIGAATASSIFFEESTTKVLGPYYLEAIAGRGLSIHFNTPKKITANTALLVTNTGSISFAIDVLGFIAPG